MNDLDMEIPEIPDFDEDLEEETPELDIFEHILTLEGGELVAAIQELENKKIRLGLKTISSPDLIELNPKEDVEAQFGSYSDWEFMKRFTIMDFESNTLTYPRFDEQLDSPYFSKKKNPYVAALGFDYMDCTSLSKPLGIEIVRIIYGKKGLNNRDKRFLTPETKRVEEIFLYNFDTKTWSKVKDTNEDYLKRIKVINYIEKVFRKHQDKYYESYEFLLNHYTYFKDASFKTLHAHEHLKRIYNHTRVMDSLLIYLQFYDYLTSKEYAFLKNEVDFLVDTLREIIKDMLVLNPNTIFLNTTYNDDDLELRKPILNRIEKIELTHQKLFYLGSITNLFKMYTSVRLDSQEFYKDTLVSSVIKKMYYIDKSPRQLKSAIEIFGQNVKRIPNLSTVMSELKRTKDPISQNDIDNIMEEIKPLFE